jgi:hypothetical protein
VSYKYKSQSALPVFWNISIVSFLLPLSFFHYEAPTCWYVHDGFWLVRRKRVKRLTRAEACRKTIIVAQLDEYSLNLRSRPMLLSEFVDIQHPPKQFGFHSPTSFANGRSCPPSPVL